MNGSKLPSGDGYNKPKRKNRTSSGRKRGGQLGHQRSNMQHDDNPDVIKHLITGKSSLCGEAFDPNNAVFSTRRPVVGPPEIIDIITSEYPEHCCRCGECGTETTGNFPDHVKVQVQYTPNNLALIS